MLTTILTYLPAIIGVLLIGLFVLLSNSKSLQNLFFAISNFLIASWLLFLMLSELANNPGDALILTRIGLFCGQLMMLFFYFFALHFPYKSNYSLIRQGIYSLPMIILSLLLLTPLGVTAVEVTNTGTEIAQTGPIYNIADVFTLGYLVLSMAVILGKYKKSKIDQKRQIKFLIIGLVIAGLSNLVANIILANIWGGTTVFTELLSNFSIVIFSTFVAYTIIKYKLFDIRLFVAIALAYVLSLALLLLLFIGGTFTLATIFSNDEVPVRTLIIFSFISIIGAIIFQPIKHFFDKVTNRFFYRDAYDRQDFLNAINAKIVKSNDLYTLLTETAEDIKSTIKVNNVSFYIDSSAAIDFHTAGTNTSLFAKTEWSELLKDVNKLDKKVITSESLEVPEDTIKLMRKLNIELILKMTSKDENVGYLLLSERKSGTNFGLQDIQVLEIIADELAITVQNAVQLEQIAQFNVTLQRKIDNATNELQQSNEKLVKLDEAKDEFISMASHQLRTPLTSVKGYISMILEGDAGDINETQKKFLDQAYISSQRMVYLIADLLNVSRLKTGKFVIEKAPTYLPDVVESEVSQLYGTAEARDLKLVFHKPDDFPTIDLDETKIRQVIMNFADNAIYYTPHGGKITIALKKLKNSIEYTVTDTGIGVPKSEQHHLFNKFYRAANAKKARPDGTGLGLYMAKKVVVAQGGAIIFKTTEGKGSTFGFSFPLSKDAQKDNTIADESEDK